MAVNVVKKKNDDKILKTLREIVQIGGNKSCFDCNQKGITYCNMTLGSFVCTSCSGILRGLTPPHRVKSISMATFTQEEIDFLRQHGNDSCAKTWLGLWDPKRPNKQDHREFMIDKYERKRYFLEPATPIYTATGNQHHHLPPTTTTSHQQQQQPSNLATKQMSQENLNILKSVTLTPPSTLNLNKNHHHTNSNNNLSINSNMNKFQQQFTPDDNFSSRVTTLPGTGISLPPPASSRNGGQSLASARLVNGDSSTSHANQFTPSSDFVADFSKANIFDATNNNNSNNNNISINNEKNLKNNFNKNLANNNSHQQNNLVNGGDGGNFRNGDNNTDNWADFDHNPVIYNAAANNCTSNSSLYRAKTNVLNANDYGNDTNLNTISCNFLNNNNNLSHTNNNNNNNNNNNCNNQNQNQNQNNINLNNNNNNNSNSATQWNLWQQFQWPYTLPEQNRWSLPMSLSSTSNSISSSGTFNSNSSINATADKYAALKDLDEQFKIEKSDTFSGGLNVAAGGVTNGTNGQPVNPFKPNPFQQQQQQQLHQQQQQQLHQQQQQQLQQQQQQLQQQQQQQHQAQFNWGHEQGFANNNGGFFGTNFVQQNQVPQNALHTNGFGAQYSAFNGFDNGTARLNNNMGFGVQPAGKSAFGNPFMAATTTTTNANNPFL